MSPSEAGTILVWGVLALLTLAVAGLVVRFAELRRDVEIALQLRAPAPGDEADQPTYGLPMLRAADDVVRRRLGLTGTAFAVLVADPDCVACRQSLQDLNDIARVLPAGQVLVLVEAEYHRASSSAFAPDLEVRVDKEAWDAVPGERPVLIFGTPRGSRVAAVTGREQLSRILAPQLEPSFEGSRE
jgi:hypothetical protein